MSKELKALKSLREQNDYMKQRNIPKEYRYDDELDIIETTLENYDDLLEKYDFNDIKELDDFLHEHRFIHQWQLDNAKKLKAFEIIKEKKVNVRFLISCKTLKEYNDVISDHLIQEEYDLLNEVLL